MTWRQLATVTVPMKVGKALAWRYRRYQDDAFDKKFGLDTMPGDASYLDQVAFANAAYAVPYEPVQVFMFRRMLGAIAIDYSDYVFLDLGSGKGRAVILAAESGFSEIIGIEFSAELQTIAERNVRAYISRTQAKSDIRLICTDATDFELPRRNLVVFLYNPFLGPAMQAVVDRIARFVVTEPCDLWLLYRNPQCSDLVGAVQGLHVTASTGPFQIYRKTQRST